MVRVKLQFSDPLYLKSFLAFTSCKNLVVDYETLTLWGCYSCADVALAIDHLGGNLLELAASPAG